MSRGAICELLSPFSRRLINVNFPLCVCVCVCVCLVMACRQKCHSHIENRSTARQFILVVWFSQRTVEDFGLLGCDAASLGK